MAMAVGLAVFWPWFASGAEIHLRSRCDDCGPLVMLGDIAEIAAADARQAESLKQIELFPAPPPGRRRFVRLREIQDLLLLRGINLVGHRFSGSSQVEITAPSTPARQVTAKSKSVSPTMAERTRRRLREAIVQYLNNRVSDSRLWPVEVDPDRSQIELLSNGTRISVGGGSPGWIGDQQFEVGVDSPDGPVRLTLDAKVTVPQAVVVTTRSLARDTVILASDVRLATDVPVKEQVGAFQSIDQVVGQQVLSAIPAEKVLRQDHVRPPLLIRRGDVVTVYARSTGIRVRTNARAKENGSLGELINVESLLERKTYLARVSGIHEVEVYARSMRTTPAKKGPGPICRNGPKYRKRDQVPFSGERKRQ